ncbi:MAG TPA: PPK2 family polyphosphate kinase [Dinghuibacter sp.]|uniref:PPK2 family polyphosphate kinase n=1 Tax=Dinghuibacter sp. TaxID=2024697 RepID=UPI002B8A07ED|nr:PPK2 family polyphosphate kinase [Dinghuibacter sp.]HTJ12887.1 PPK2 family polyphosphate kinase [Dinghuibacter sp.]
MGKVKLAAIATRAPNDIDKEATKKRLETLLEELDDLQNLLYAEDRHALLVVIQGMDASGKDGLIRRVFGRLNPQGVQVASFKEPTPVELSHDFLWRIHAQAPARGRIQVFNRSHYEDILITRVHKMITDDVARERMRAINDFEWLLQEHGNTDILKFYLHTSPEERHKRLEERLTIPSKMWKYNDNDLKEAKFWPEYEKAYEDCFNHCNAVPWIIVPSDQNWYKEYVVAETLRDTLKRLKMKYPGLKK